MKKISFVLALCMLFSIITGAAAYNINDSETHGTVQIGFQPVNIEWESPNLIADVDSITIKDSITIGGQGLNLYPTFDNPDDALNEISISAIHVIELLQETYTLQQFTSASWKSYHDAMYNMFSEDSCPDWYNESNIEFRELRSFFDIYENEEKNANILNQLVLSYNNVGKQVISEDQLSDIMVMLPYTSVEGSSWNMPTTTSVVHGFDTAKGIEYANTYAEKANTAQYHEFGNGDCTNFMSQILEAGGVQQVNYDNDTTKGWWHTVTTGIFGIKSHKHSLSWTMADTFTRYMGIGYTTELNSEISKNIVAGDFLAADFDSDGDWDHMGFVTEKGAYLTSEGYYNYKIAQHTSNYLAWANTSKNGWDHVGTDGGTYARVRR